MEALNPSSPASQRGPMERGEEHSGQTEARYLVPYVHSTDLAHPMPSSSGATLGALLWGKNHWREACPVLPEPGPFSVKVKMCPSSKPLRSG